jgi:hypothetical protein
VDEVAIQTQPVIHSLISSSYPLKGNVEPENVLSVALANI